MRSNDRPDLRGPSGGIDEYGATPGRRATFRPEEQFAVTVDRRARRPVVVVAGELDAAGASLLRAVVDHVSGQGHRGPVLVDLGAVRYADTHGLAPVLDGTAEVRAASTAVRRVLRLLGLPDPRPAGPVLRA